MRIHLKTDIELVVAKICYPIETLCQFTGHQHITCAILQNHDKNIEGV